MGGISAPAVWFDEIVNIYKPLNIDPRSVECALCRAPIGGNCLRMTYNRPKRVMTKNCHHQRVQDARSVQAMRDALL